MEMKGTKRGLVMSLAGTASIIGVLLITYGSPTQSGAFQKDSVDPVAIDSAIKQASNGSEISYTIHNKSPKDILAFTLVTTYFGADNKPIGRLTTNQLFGMEARSARQSLPPNETWTPKKGLVTSTDQNGAPSRYEIMVDYVLFKDGSTWGADQAKQSLQIAGILQGWSLARNSLKSVLLKEGPRAVLQILNQDVPHNHK